MRITINISDDLAREEKISVSIFLSENIKRFISERKRKFHIDRINKRDACFWEMLYKIKK